LIDLLKTREKKRKKKERKSNGEGVWKDFRGGGEDFR
jgi:hypothetical protein